MIEQTSDARRIITHIACTVDGEEMAQEGRLASLSVLAAFGAALMAAMPARAADEPALAFFQGKQVRFYTMGSPGGGYDTYMRALIPHLEKKLGARMLPTNEPGAGGLIAV